MFAIPRVVIFMTGDHMVVYAGDVDVDMDLASQNINDNYAHKGHDGSGVTNPKLVVTDNAGATANPQPVEAELPSTSRHIFPKDPSPEQGRSQGKRVKYVRSHPFTGPEQPEENTGCRKCGGGKCSVM